MSELSQRDINRYNDVSDILKELSIILKCKPKKLKGNIQELLKHIETVKNRM